jgi:hypothetical protein
MRARRHGTLTRRRVATSVEPEIQRSLRRKCHRPKIQINAVPPETASPEEPATVSGELYPASRRRPRSSAAVGRHHKVRLRAQLAQHERFAARCLPCRGTPEHDRERGLGRHQRSQRVRGPSTSTYQLLSDPHLIPTAESNALMNQGKNSFRAPTGAHRSRRAVRSWPRCSVSQSAWLRRRPPASPETPQS